LTNTTLAAAKTPVLMGSAMRKATEARIRHLAGHWRFAGASGCGRRLPNVKSARAGTRPIGVAATIDARAAPW